MWILHRAESSDAPNPKKCYFVEVDILAAPKRRPILPKVGALVASGFGGLFPKKFARGSLRLALLPPLPRSGPLGFGKMNGPVIGPEKMNGLVHVATARPPLVSIQLKWPSAVFESS